MAFVDNEWVSIPLPSYYCLYGFHLYRRMLCTCVYVCMYVRAYVHACVCVHVCMHACIYVCVCIHMSSYSWLKKLLLFGADQILIVETWSQERSIIVLCTRERSVFQLGNYLYQGRALPSEGSAIRGLCHRRALPSEGSAIGGLCHQSNSITGAFKGFKRCDSVGVYMRMCGCGWI